MTDTLVRRYRPSDREDVLRIAADTAFFGDPVEIFLEDRRLFLDWFYAYYTELEADHLWVAIADGAPAGFLAGCPESARRGPGWRRHIFPVAAARLARGRYHIGARTRRWLWLQLVSTLRNGLPRPDLGSYPAHLHMNVARGSRGLGLGTSLLKAYLDQLRAEGVAGVHLDTTSLNESALRLYERFGFRLLEARTTSAWRGLVDQPVENRCYGLRLR